MEGMGMEDIWVWLVMQVVLVLSIYLVARLATR